MVKTKKNQNTKKKEVKKETSKKTIKAEKKITENKSQKKNNSKKSNKNKAIKVSNITDNKENKSYKTLAIIFGIILLVLFVAFGFLSYQVYKLNNNTSIENSKNTNINSSKDSNLEENILLTVVSDPNCKTCGVEEFIVQIKSQLIPDLKSEIKGLESEFSKEVIQITNAKFYPIYLFSEELQNLPDFATKLSGAFIETTIQGKKYFILNPKYVSSKVLFSEPEVKDFALTYGSEDAPLKVFMFSDYECPFCAIAEGNEALVKQFSSRVPGYTPPMPNLYNDYVETGKVQLVFYNMPIESLHPNVRPAHLASICVYKQDKDKWLKFHEKLFMDRENWVSSNVKDKVTSYAKDLGVNMEEFNTCMEDPETNQMIEESLKYGGSLGVSGTPAFYIGNNFISGAQDYFEFKKVIDVNLEKVN